MIDKDRLALLQAAAKERSLTEAAQEAALNDVAAREIVNREVDLTQPCQCGRPAAKVHCPHCGSYVVMGRVKRDRVTRPDNSVVYLTVYRCRRCSALFNDDDWQLRCKAPIPHLGRPAKADTTPETHFTSLEEVPEPLRNALEAMKKKRGIE